MAHVARLLAAASLSLAFCTTAVAADLFNNTNTGGVQNGAKGEVLMMTPTAVHVTELVTYHWNNGKGARPGTLTLKSMSGQTYGPFQAKGTSGQNNAPNVNWIADVNLQLPAGTYQLLDSDPATWSQNAATHGVGFAIIRGDRVTTAVAPAPTPTKPAPAPTRTGTAAPSGGGGAQPTAPAANTIDLFNNYNKDDVQNGARNQPTLMTPIPVKVTEIITYHWNNGKGATPGKISIKSMGGQTYGPFQARGATAWQGVQNTNWVADMNVTLPMGTYQVVDSDPATWSSNAASHNVGFAVIRGTREQGLTVAQPAPPGNVVTGGVGKPVILPPGTIKPGTGGGGSGGTGGGTAGSVSSFTPCFVNSGSIAASSPCSGAPGTKIAIKLSRAIGAPLVQAIFKPYNIALPSATAAQVMAALKGNGTASGSIYEVDAPRQLCLGGNGGWDIFLLDKNGKGQGDIGRFNVNCQPGASAGGGNVTATTTPPPPPPAPTTFKPCFVNSGSIAASSPCNAHPGDIMTVKLSRQLSSPLAIILFKPYQVTGVPGATAAQIQQKLTTGGTASGTTYNFPAPTQLCAFGNGSWDLWPVDAAGKGQGDIGRVNMICH